MILLIIIGAAIFGQFLAASRTSGALVNAVTSLEVANWIILGALMVMYLLLGTFMSASAIMLLTLPVVFPIVEAMGYHPIWFGILVIKTVEIGLATPPLGLNVYVTNGIAGGRLEDTFAGSGIFIGGDLLVLATLLAFPDIFVQFGDFVFRG
jgi:C4-dicarboxylate transporter, DctM subunit